jgi:hypothetical protein
MPREILQVAHDRVAHDRVAHDRVAYTGPGRINAVPEVRAASRGAQRPQNAEKIQGESFARDG